MSDAHLPDAVAGRLERVLADAADATLVQMAQERGLVTSAQAAEAERDRRVRRTTFLVERNWLRPEDLAGLQEELRRRSLERTQVLPR
jgi:hypothetical protein